MTYRIRLSSLRARALKVTLLSVSVNPLKLSLILFSSVLILPRRLKLLSVKRILVLLVLLPVMNKLL